MRKYNWINATPLWLSSVFSAPSPRLLFTICDLRCAFAAHSQDYLPNVLLSSLSLRWQGTSPASGGIMQLATWQLVAPPRWRHRLLQDECFGIFVLFFFYFSFLVFEASFMCVSYEGNVDVNTYCAGEIPIPMRIQIRIRIRTLTLLRGGGGGNVRVVWLWLGQWNPIGVSRSSRCSLQSLSANLGHVVNWQRLTYCCSTSLSQFQLLLLLLFTHTLHAHNEEITRSWAKKQTGSAWAKDCTLYLVCWGQSGSERSLVTCRPWFQSCLITSFACQVLVKLCRLCDATRLSPLRMWGLMKKSDLGRAPVNYPLFMVHL